MLIIVTQTILALVIMIADGVYMTESADMMATTEAGASAIIALLLVTNPILFILQIGNSKDLYKWLAVAFGVVVSVIGSAFVNTNSVASKPIEQTAITAQYESLILQRDALSNDLDPQNSNGCEFRKNCVSQEERKRLVHLNYKINELSSQITSTPNDAANKAFGGVQSLIPALTPELFLQIWIWLRAIFVSLACAALGNAIKQELQLAQLNRAVSKGNGRETKGNGREMVGKRKGNKVEIREAPYDKTRKVISIAEAMKKKGQKIRVKQIRDQAKMKTETVNNILRNHGYIENE